MKNRKVKGILFDFNGTLFFDSKLHLAAFKALYASHGRDIPTDEEIVTKYFGKSNKRLCDEFYGINSTVEEWNAYADEKEGYYRDLCLKDPDVMQYTKGALELIEYLKQNDIPYCLATGSGMDNLSFYFEHMSLLDYFDMEHIVYSNGTFNGKPEPDAYLIAADRLGLTADECIVFEDGTSGIIAAHRANAAGVICICEKGIPSPITDEAYVDAIYHDLTEWKEILSRFGLLR